MTQEEKDLLLKDLCARLPYGVKVSCRPYFGLDPRILSSITIVGRNGYYVVDGDPIAYPIREMDSSGFGILLNIKPYLRPMSSMTEEECKELGKLSAIIENVGEILPNAPYYIEVARPEQIDWLNAHHFDFRGLIEKGLAIEATEGMYKIKEEENEDN